MATSPQSQVVILPYICAVDPSDSAFAQAMHYAIRQRLYYGDKLTLILYLSSVFVCKNAAQQWAEQNSQEHEPGRFTTQNEVTELTPQIVNEIRHEYGWNTPSTVYRVLPDDVEASDNAQ
ncbi:TPA: hypothetical protein ACIPE5_000795 [Salmonella enterica subsp. diarizonae serovar 61:r:-]